MFGDDPRLARAFDDWITRDDVPADDPPADGALFDLLAATRAAVAAELEAWAARGTRLALVAEESRAEAHDALRIVARMAGVSTGRASDVVARVARAYVARAEGSGADGRLLAVLAARRLTTRASTHTLGSR